MLAKTLKNLTHHQKFIFSLLCIVAVLAIMAGIMLYNQTLTQKNFISKLQNDLSQLTQKLQSTAGELDKLKNEDQFKRNEALQKDIAAIEATYKKSVTVYEDLLKLKESTNKTAELDKQYAQILNLLSARNYDSASAQLAQLQSNIDKEQATIASAFSIPANVKQDNNPPGSGYSRQSVNTDIGTFLVDIIAADLNSTRVIVDTSSESDCRNDCPVSSLGDFASRSGAFAGINGPYFCPAEYPSCADKKNSFDTLLMNKNKYYFNSDNNVYSTVPAVIFQGNSARFITQSLQWGRDSGADSVIASQPLMVFDGNVVFGGDEEVKRAGKGSRSFIGASDNTAYMGIVYNANVAEVARVLKAMGIKNALNLDSGGSTALWNNGRYLVGPGRNTPFGILFVRK